MKVTKAIKQASCLHRVLLDHAEPQNDCTVPDHSSEVILRNNILATFQETSNGCL